MENVVLAEAPRMLGFVDWVLCTAVEESYAWILFVLPEIQTAFAQEAGDVVLRLREIAMMTRLYSKRAS